MHILQHRNPRIFANNLSEDALWFQDIEKPLFSLVPTVGQCWYAIIAFFIVAEVPLLRQGHLVFDDSDGDNLAYGGLVEVLLCLPLWSVVIFKTTTMKMP